MSVFTWYESKDKKLLTENESIKFRKELETEAMSILNRGDNIDEIIEIIDYLILHVKRKGQLKALKQMIIERYEFQNYKPDKCGIL